MEFQVDRKELLKRLALMQNVVERRGAVPILEHVLVEVNDGFARISATDLDVGIRARIAADIGLLNGNSSAFTLSARKLFQVLRESDGERLEIRTLEGDWIELKIGRARYKMMGLDPRSFPALPNDGGEIKGTLTIRAGVLSDLINHTIFAVSPDEARYNLSGVCLESSEAGKARLIATDGHRLAMVENATLAEFKIGRPALIPRKALTELQKLLDAAPDDEIELSISPQLAFATIADTEFVTRLVEGEFPDYRGVIPKHHKYAINLGRDGLLAAIKRCAIFSNERYHGVKLALSENTLMLSSAAPETGEASETLETIFNGLNFDIGINASYLLQGISVVPEGTEVTLNLSDEVSPLEITAEADPSYRYIVMPMRL